jgi:hydrogenase maturation protein HypF
VATPQGAGSSSGALSPSSEARRRVGVRVRGVVQGVGFRPHVYRLAEELSLDGFVLNDAHGVLLEIEGSPMNVARFLERLVAEPPPLATIDSVEPSELASIGQRGFQIAPSRDVDGRSGIPHQALVSPDTAACADCLAEMNDPADRRYRYPFINCTNCGPRFTIATDVPYDRAATTMADFVMCERCRAEYEDPGDRRFHAQPNACPQCGPHARLLKVDSIGATHASGGSEGAANDSAGRVPSDDDALRAAVEALASGLIVAVKGLGGYHLACRADSQEAAEALRERKHREDRPFALMVGDLSGARALIELDAASKALLVDRARPIVLARRRPGALVADAVAPGCPDLGVMLPYTPLHHLLLADLGRLTGERGGCLVMTSGNLSEEPIAYNDEDALARLREIADAFLLHDRPIHMRTDDSVLRHTAAGPLMMRRSRGYVPSAIALPVPAGRPLLACGAELKNTFCVANHEHAWVSHHIGDLKNYETLVSYRKGIEHFQRLFAVTPQLVVHDLHPDYLSTGYALQRGEDEADPAPGRATPPDHGGQAGSSTVEHLAPFGSGQIETIGVQHHHAHLAACLAEHGETGPVVGAIFDGNGYGTDGMVWGGELLVGDLCSFERVGHLRPVRLPGGDRAVNEPWRMACAWLTATLEDDGLPPLPAALSEQVDPERWATIAQLSRSELAPFTTSAGRLFDAVGALCGAREVVSYEGQSAIELEGLVDPAERGAYPIELTDRFGVLELDPRPAVLAVLAERTAGVAAGVVAARFHSGLAQTTAEACARIAGAHGLDTVVLSGGVFQNRVLLESTIERLQTAGLRMLFPRLLPPNDGGVAYGQAAVAAARISRR